MPIDRAKRWQKDLNGLEAEAGANVYARNARPVQKKDAAVALIMAIARCMAAQPARSVCESRGLVFVG